jgi:nitrile hydratase
MAGLGDRLGARKQLASQAAAEINAIPWACHEAPIFAIGDRVRILRRVPIRHYRVPTYLRGKEAVIEKIIEPSAMTVKRRARCRGSEIYN